MNFANFSVNCQPIFKKLRKLFPSHAAITLKNGVGTVYNLYIPDPAQTGILFIIIWSRINYTKNNTN